MLADKAFFIFLAFYTNINEIMRSIITLLCSIITYMSVSGQQSGRQDYTGVFDWVTAFYAENDAGYPTAVALRGEDAVAAHTEVFRGMVAAAADEEEFITVVNRWLRFFRRGHHYFIAVDPSDNGYSSGIEEEYKPSFRMLSDRTAVLTINSFGMEYKPYIDQVLAENDAVIRSTPNLIVDIRRSRGGSDVSFYNILPYIYTNPITTFPMEVLSTPANIAAQEEMADWIENNTELTEEAELLRSIVEKMRENPGGFIELDKDIYPDYEVLPFPRKVGLVFRINNGSTDEEFILAARQSTKVKTFGVPTLGAIDISNVRSAVSPDGRFRLDYSVTRSTRMESMKVDDVGIQPDFLFPSEIHNRDWLEHVQRILEYN